MRRTILPSLLAALLCGCGLVRHEVKFDGVEPAAGAYVRDATEPDGYPPFGFAEGYIFSCRYGIHHQSREDFDPPKDQVFAALLAKNLPVVVKHEVVLQRFDVYYNHRLKALKQASIGTGGIVGQIMAETARQNENVFTYKQILIDLDPASHPRPKNENQVGCDDANEGEYYASEITGGADVIVTWLKFTIDGKPYHVRSFYPFHPEEKPEVAQAIRKAIGLTVEGASTRIRLR